MTPRARFKLHSTEKGGIAALVVGLAALLLVRTCGVTDGFWVTYTDGFRFAGWMITGTAAAWLVLSSLRHRTFFFRLDQPLDAERFGASIAAVAIVIFIAIAVVLPRLPATEPADLPREPAARQRVVDAERHFRYYVATMLAFAGIALVSSPAIRFFRK